jgi:hypothetical protein
MSLTAQARSLYPNRRHAAQWVLARLYLNQRGLQPYRHLPMAVRIVNNPN